MTEEDEYGDLVFDPEAYAALGLGAYTKRDEEVRVGERMRGVYQGPRIPNVGGKRCRPLGYGIAQVIMDYNGLGKSESLKIAGVI